MINSGSRSNSTDSDYELMQQQLPPPPPTPENRLQRGYSIREPRQPPLYQVPRPPQPSRVSPNRWRHLHRLSPGRNRNYAGLQDLRRGQRSEYAVPRVNRETEARRYDAFFRMSIAEEEEEEEGGREEREEHDEEAEKSIGNMTIVSEMSEPCSRHCKCLLLVFFLLLLLLTSLGGLGLALYNKFTRESSGGTQQAIMGTTCTETWCEHTVTMAVHAANCSMYNTSSECVTEPLSTNISGFTPVRFNCIADTYNSGTVYSGQSYENEMHRDKESVFCKCKFSKNVHHGQCSVVGDYCADQDTDNGTSRTPSYYTY